MAMQPQVNIRLIVVVGLVTVLALLVLGIAVDAWFRYEQRREIAQYENRPNTALENALLDQRMKINSYRWVDQRAQVAAIPIDEAIKAIIRSGGKLPATRPQEPGR